MIVTDDPAPRWIRELARFLPLKNVLFLYGNVLDMVSFPKEGDVGKVVWVEGFTLSLFLRRFLQDAGYEIAGAFDPVEGLEFVNDEMKKLYDRVRLGKATVRELEAGATESRPTATEPAKGESPTSVPARTEALADAKAAVIGMAAALRNTKVPCAFVLTHASRLIRSPGYPSEAESELFTRLFHATLRAARVTKEHREWRNLVIVVCDKLNDLPPYLFLNHPGARSICIDKPDASERSRWFDSNRDKFNERAAIEQEPLSGEGAAAASGGKDDEDCDRSRESLKQQASPRARFSLLTEGFTYTELRGLALLSQLETLPVAPPEPLVKRYKYGVTKSEWDTSDLRDRMKNAEQIIRDRVKGQEAALARTLDLIKRALLGLAAGAQGKTHRPRGVLFLAGPTGVGKTEMAKALAELLFGSEERLIRFDMSEYGLEHAEQRLLGAPPGYVGYEEGGQLTNAVREHPFSVLLFDEIDKAHNRIFDKFLQILDDGRLTDGRGETVYFSECVIIFTSNLGTVSLDKRAKDTHRDLPSEAPRAIVSQEMDYKAVRETILKAISEFFTVTLGRPEIFNRFGDNFVVFDYIRPPVDEQIVTLLLEGLQKALDQERKIDLKITDQAEGQLLLLARSDLTLGGRGIRNMIDAALVNPLARWLFDQGIERNACLELNAIKDHGPHAAYRFELEISRQET